MKLVKVVFIMLSVLFEVILNPDGEMARSILSHEEESDSPNDLMRGTF